ncbi:hypothetical protein LAZ67_6002573 [Cordylochernes scorpioides]|uniref:Uncharacterized protein n=1 Tax=Cordylochernes scorpioides TaxID=51811 RepID=A0ABY6KNI7_9ARAC|nr:hypothetical protein LAZ67_6002573 [Cordylochernes scorpioides]
MFPWIKIKTQPVPRASRHIAEESIVPPQAIKIVNTPIRKGWCLLQAPKTRHQPNKTLYQHVVGQEFLLRPHWIFKDPIGRGMVYRPYYTSENASWENTSLRMRSRAATAGTMNERNRKTKYSSTTRPFFPLSI